MLGKVIHYDPNGKFGFIEVKGHERTIYFSNDRQRSYYCDLDNEIYGNGEPGPEPKVNDRVIVFALQYVDKGPRASYWAHESTWLEAKEVKKLMQTYRLRNRKGRKAVSHLDPRPEYVTIFEGKNLLELKHIAEPFQIKSDDFDYYFYEYLNGDVWEECDCPLPDTKE